MLSCTADAAVDDKAYGWALSMVLDDSLHWEDPKGHFEFFFSFFKHLNVILRQTKTNITNYMTN